jgi:putative membrane protein
MSRLLQTGLGAWRFPIGGTLALLAVALVYLRGWLRLRRAAPHGPWAFRLCAFSAGIGVLWIALWSPLALVDHDLLIAHMVQHLLLMTVAAPLLLLGAPAMVLVRAISARLLLHSPRWLVRTPALRGGFSLVTHPVVCWCAATFAVVIWHVPAAFALAMSSPGWHSFQRATFLGSGLLFWWPVIQPWPAISRWSRWSVPLYLFLATLPCDALSAFLAFCGRAVYPAHPCGTAMSLQARLDDQVSAGALMWFWVTVAYLIPATWSVMRTLSASGRRDALDRALDSWSSFESHAPAVQPPGNLS